MSDTSNPTSTSADRERDWWDETEDLLDIVEKDVEGWRPEPGDKLAGIVTDITEGSSEYGDYPLITVQKKDGTLVGVHCFHQVVRNEINRKIDSGRLRIGDLIAFSYKGEGEARNGKNAPNMYRVAVKPVGR